MKGKAKEPILANGKRRRDLPDEEKSPLPVTKSRAKREKPDHLKHPAHVRDAKDMAERTKAAVAALALPDEKAPLQAAGFCGRKNRCWRVSYIDASGIHRLKTFAWRTGDPLRPAKVQTADEFLDEVREHDPDPKLVKYRPHEYCHRRPTRESTTIYGHPGAKRRPFCEVHGAKAKRGPASPSWGTGKSPAGKYSTVLRGNYLRAYEDSMRGEEIPNLREQIAIVEVREDELFRMIADRQRELGDGPTAWRTARKLIERCRAELRVEHMRLLVASGSLDDFMGPFGELEKLLTVGAESDTAWEDMLKNVIPARRKLVETQNRMAATSEAYVPVAEMMVVSARMIDLVRRCFGVIHPGLAQFVDGMEEILSGASPLRPSGLLEMKRIPSGDREDEGTDGGGVPASRLTGGGGSG